MNRLRKQFLFLPLFVLLGIAVSALIMSFFSVSGRELEAAHAYRELQDELSTLEIQNEQLVERHEALERKRSMLIGRLEGTLEDDTLLEERSLYEVIAGLTDVEGPGLEITLNDKADYEPVRDSVESIVHDRTVIHVTDLLRSNGARALSFNGIRLTAVPQISCIGPTIMCLNTRQAPPYVIRAIGPVEEMKSALSADPYLQHITDRDIGIRLKITESDRLIVPSLAKTTDYQPLMNLLD